MSQVIFEQSTFPIKGSRPTCPVILCHLMKVYGCFGETYCLCLQDRSPANNQGSNTNEALCLTEWHHIPEYSRPTLHSHCREKIKSRSSPYSQEPATSHSLIRRLKICFDIIFPPTLRKKRDVYTNLGENT